MNALEYHESAGEGVLVKPSSGAAWARVSHANVQHAFKQPGEGPRLVIWSGTPAEHLFDRDPRAWLANAMQTLIETCHALASAGRYVLVRPHARHTLGDVQRCVRFLSEVPRDRIGIVLDPASLLEPGMLPHAEDHLRRAFETLGPLCQLVWLASVSAPRAEPPDDEAEDPVTQALEPVRFSEGLLSPARMIEFWRRFCPPETPLVAPGLSTRELEAWVRA